MLTAQSNVVEFPPVTYSILQAHMTTV